MTELFDNGAERAVLAGLLQYGSEVYVEISDIVEDDSFGSLNNKIIFKCLKDVIESDMKVDLPAILASAERLGHKDTITTDREIQYIKSLSDFYINKDNVFNFAMEIKKYEFARKIKSIARNVGESIDNLAGGESIDDIISLLENPVVEFLKEDSVGEKPELLADDIFSYLEYLENNQCDIVGIPTGFSRYDAAIGGGIRRKCVDLIAARPKTGKSVFADAVAINVAGIGVPVLMLDTEMGKNDHIHRILASLSGIDLKLIETGKFANDDSKYKVHEAAHKLKGMPYDYISVAGKSFESILNIIKRWVFHKVGVDEKGVTKDCLIIYDYLKLMSGSSLTATLQEYQALGFQITSLHNLCVKLDIPCLSFVQLNRDGITKESTDAVSGSDRLIWLCTSFTIFKHKSDEEIAEDGPQTGNRKLVPIVARHGGGLNDGDYINMNMVGKQTRLEELKTRNEFKASPKNGSCLITEQSIEEAIENVHRLETIEESVGDEEEDDLPFTPNK